MALIDVGKKICYGLKIDQLLDTDAEKQLMLFGRQNQTKAGRICDRLGERNHVNFSKLV